MDRGRIMVFNTTFSNISFILMWRSVLLMEETGVSRENHWPAACHRQTLSPNVSSTPPHHQPLSMVDDYQNNNSMRNYVFIFYRLFVSIKRTGA
jgi:hypothetical protein